MTIRFLGRWGGRWDLSSVGLHAAIKKLDRHKSEPFRIGVSLINGAHDAFCELVTGLFLRMSAGKVLGPSGVERRGHRRERLRIIGSGSRFWPDL